MKKLTTLVLALAFAGVLFAQETTQGKVIFQEVMKLDIKLEGEGAQFADMLPKERKAVKELLFTPDASIYRKSKDAEEAEDVSMDHGGMSVQIKMAEPDNQFYVDIKKQKTIEKQEFMSRNFLIEDGVEASGWKLTGEQKSILDYSCQKAIKRDKEDKEIIAWFTPAIPVSTGPVGYIGLPGLVLEVVTNNGDNTITAKSIELAEVDKADISKPKKGKKVTREQYDKIVEEKMKEMGAQQGEGGGTFIMRIER